MAREIEKTVAVQKAQDVTFDRQSVYAVGIIDKGEEGHELQANVRLSSTQSDDEAIDKLAVNLDTVTVQQAIDELEAFAGTSVDLSTVSVTDFIHSIVHERLTD